MKLAVLVLMCDIEIPMLVFSSFEAGLKRCEEIFGFKPDEIREGEDELIGYEWAVLMSEKYPEDKDHAYDYVRNDKKLTSKMSELVADWDNFFYTPGGIYAFDLIEVEEGTPFVRFHDTYVSDGTGQ